MRTRVRTTNDLVPAGTTTWTYEPEWASYSGTGVNNYTAYPYFGLDETMIDQYAYKRHTGYCKHTKVRLWFNDQPVKYKHFTGQIIPSGYPNSGQQIWRFVTFTGSTLVRRFFPTNPWPAITPNQFDWASAASDAVQAMRPSLPEVLVPNLVIELVEAARLIGPKARKTLDNIERRRQQAARERERMKEFNARNKRRAAKGLPPLDRPSRIRVPDGSVWNRSFNAIRKITNRFAWLNLAWQFALRPTLQDTVKITEIITTLESTLSDLIRKANDLQVRHYKRPADVVVLPSRTRLSTQSYDGDTTTEVWRENEWFTRPVYHASMYFTYDASRLTGWVGKINALVHSLGVNKLASVVWEAIPYSFVVDWFVNVGEVIESIEDSILDPLPIIIHDFSHSLKYEYRTNITWNYQYYVIDIAHKVTSYYERRRDIPSLWDSLSVRSPNLNQVGLGLSLIIVKMDGVNRKKRK